MSISDALDQDFAPAWRPGPGDKLVGTVTGLSEREGYNGDPYPIVTVRQEDGTELAFHAFHTVAQNELARLRPQVGDEIGIKYLGLLEAETGRSKYHGYKIRTSGSSPGVNWGKYGDGGEPEPDVPVDSGDLPQPPAPTAQAAADVDDGPIPF